MPCCITWRGRTRPLACREPSTWTGRATVADPIAEPPLPRWKRVLFTGILVILVLGIPEILAALYLRAFEGYDGRHLYQYVYDPYKNILPTPNYVDTRGIRHNSAGFRRSTEVLRQ